MISTWYSYNPFTVDEIVVYLRIVRGDDLASWVCKGSTTAWKKKKIHVPIKCSGARYDQYIEIIAWVFHINLFIGPKLR